MHISKNDLAGEYKWPSITTTKDMSEPSRRSFDRNNGHHVLFIINYYASGLSAFSVDRSKELEVLISDHMPTDIQSEISVYRWLKANAS